MRTPARRARRSESSTSDRATRYERITLDFDALAADVYWIRAIQHYGGDRLSPSRERKFELLAPLLDLTTTLDPYFTIAYRFGAIFLSEAPPGGPGRSDLAISLLEKGLTAQPGKWQYFHDIAFVNYWHRRDLKAAATWFQRAAEQPNSPNWLPPLAAGILTAGNDRASARFLWNEILKSDEKWLRDNAARSLRQLDTLDLIDQLQAVVQRYPPAPGEPYSLEALVRAPRAAVRAAGRVRDAARDRSADRRDHGFACVASLAHASSSEMTADPLTLAAFAILGLAVGSFLNVCIHRLPSNKSIVQPPSSCPHCGYRLRWIDNIPVVSYALLGGRCRQCKAPISMRYPIVEILTMAMFVLHYLVLGLDIILVPRLLFACAMIVLFAIDLEHHLLPNVITIPGIVVGLAFSAMLPPGFVDALIGALAGGGVLWLIAEAYYRYSGQEGMGGGDVKMLAMIGAFLGWKLVILTLGTVVAPGLAHRRGSPRRAPWGPEVRPALRNVPVARGAGLFALRRAYRRLVRKPVSLNFGLFLKPSTIL